MPPHEALLRSSTMHRDPDGLRADEATVVFAERLRFAYTLSRMSSVREASRRYGGALDGLVVLDLTIDEARAEWHGTFAAVTHARTLGLTGWADATGVWRRE